MAGEIFVEGFQSAEEAIQEYIELFAALQKLNKKCEEDDLGEREKLFMDQKRILEEKERLSNVFLPGPYLKERCALTETEYWLVMFAFCCEVEEGLCIDYGGDGSRGGNWPTIRYALHLLSCVLSVNFGLIAKLCGGKGGLGDILRLYSGDAGEEADRGILSQPLLLNRGAFYFLLTGALRQEEWYELFPVGSREDRLCDQECLPLHKEEYGCLYSYLEGSGRSGILLYGSRGSGKHTLLRRVCHERRVNAVFVKLQRICEEDEQRWNRRLQELRLIYSLVAPVIILDLTGEMPDDTFTPRKAGARLEAFMSDEWKEEGLVLMADSAAWEEAAGRLAEARVDLRDVLTGDEIKLALDAWLTREEREEWQERMLNGYRLNIGEFGHKKRRICAQADAWHISPADRRVWEAGLREQGGNLRLGRLIKVDCDLDDLILSMECRAQLETVMELAQKWGGGGLTLLFHGSSGTGKTMAASVLANRLRHPLLKVDISQIYDKYIGETEKHLDEVFRLARRDRCLLFFDEADTLFARRTNIQDSHDKYANVSTAYLLQRIEEYDGIVILATNLLDHFDDAFVRRIRFVIKFRNLDLEGRRQLWEKALEGIPAVSADVSFEALARAVSFSPARIRSAAQVAKLLALCGESGTVTTEHLRKALELEAGKDETAIRGLTPESAYTERRDGETI